MNAAESHPDQTAQMGDLLLAGGFVRKRELDEALNVSKRIHKPLCQVLQGQQKISSCEKRSLLSLQNNLRRAFKKDKLPMVSELGCRMGDLLITCGDITHDQLASALTEQSKKRSPLGSILLKNGFVGLKPLAYCLQLQQKLMSAAAAAILAVAGTSASYADDPVVNDPSWGQLQPNFTTQAPHALRDSWRKPGYTRARLSSGYGSSDEIMRSKSGKMVLRLTDTGMEFRAFF